uniref:Elicitin n=1 Tax=Thraustotheca clavata TaxID=74557 RepID=A0A0A7CMN5_9STRA|nr:secreted protein [Thraustotheca clavata]
MKTSAILLAFAGAVSAATPSCEIGALASAIAPAIVTSASYAPCKTDSGYDITTLALGTTPTEDQVKKIVASANCGSLYKDMQKAVVAFTPVCSIGGVDTSDFGKLSIAEGLAAVGKMSGSTTTTGTPTTGTTTTGTNSTSGNSTVSTTGPAGVTTVPATTTAAPAKSSAVAAGVTIAAVAFTAVAALH